MSLRNKKRNTHMDRRQNIYNPVIGLLNPLTSLDCHLELKKQQLKFCLNFQHPLHCITKVTKNCKKYAFQKIIEISYNIKIEQKHTFLPQALLNGNESIIHEYKKMLQKGRIGSYIPLNIKHRQRSLEKKRPASSDHNSEKQQYHTTKLYQQKIFNQNSINTKTVRNNYQKIIDIRKIVENHIQIKENNQNNLFVDNSFNKRKYSVAVTPQTQKSIHMTPGYQKQSSHIYESDIRIVHNHQQNGSKQLIKTPIKMTKSSNKKREGIKISYTIIKSTNQNPQTQSFIFQSNATKSKHSPSQYGPKTEIINLNTGISKMNKTHQDLNANSQMGSFSVHNDKLSQHNWEHHKDNFSQRYERSLKNSQISEMTNKEIFQEQYFYNDRKILKKNKKAIYVENMEKIEIH